MSLIDTTGIRYSTELPYRYEFFPEELDAMRLCQDEHGFAVVKQVVSEELVEILKNSVREILLKDEPLASGKTVIHSQFIEHSSPMASLLEHDQFMAIARVLHGEVLTVHRTAAIAKNVGAGPLAWHTDWSSHEMTIRHASTWLNASQGCHAMWFYLNGTHPSRAGLAVIPDSHQEDWTGPEGFQVNKGMSTFHREDEEPSRYAGIDVPGILPLLTDPGDLILFTERTYHAVFPHEGDEMRLSCGIKFRPGRTSFPVPWPLSESAKTFINNAPARVYPMVEHYVGYDGSWPIDGGRPEY